MKFQPLRDEVLVEFVPMAERLTPAGLILPEIGETDHVEREQIVRAVGPGRMLDDGRVVMPAVKPGDYVYIRPAPDRPPGFRDPDDGKLYAVMPESWITAIVTEQQKALSPTVKLIVPAPTPVKIGKNGRMVPVRP